MQIKLNNTRVFPFVAGLVGLMFVSSCKKSDVEPLGDKGKTYVKFVDYGGTDGGFSSSGFPSGTESVNFQIELVTPKVFKEDIKVTVDIDRALVAKYNSEIGDPTDPTTQYFVLPDSTFTFASQQLTIPAGNTMSTEGILKFFADKIDGGYNYMLPIKVTAVTGGGGGATIEMFASSVAYFHFIGNPLAGAYSATGYFYHPSSPRAFTRTGGAGALVAYSPTALSTELGDLGASGYYALINVPDPANTATVQNVTISVYPGSIAPVLQWNAALPSDSPGYTAGWARSGECNNTYNPATKTFYLRYGYASAGVYRVTEEIIKKD